MEGGKKGGDRQIEWGGCNEAREGRRREFKERMKGGGREMGGGKREELRKEDRQKREKNEGVYHN